MHIMMQKVRVDTEIGGDHACEGDQEIFFRRYGVSPYRGIDLAERDDEMIREADFVGHIWWGETV